MSAKNILSDLDAIIKRSSAVKVASVKQEKVAAEGGISAKLDNAEDNTQPAATGAQAADNKAEAAKGGGAKVDGSAKTNPVGGSVEASTDGATAVAADGQSGAKGADLSVQGKADNGPEGVFKEAKALRDYAAELRKQAAALLTPLDNFLVKAARASTDPKVKTAAEGMGDDDLADNASDVLMEQLSSGQISEEEAGQILQEAVDSGAISEEDIAQAAQMAQGAGEAPAAEGAPEAAPAPEGVGAVPPAASEELPPEAQDELAAKVAMLNEDLTKAEGLSKIAHLFGADISNGRSFALKLAEEIAHEASETPAEEKVEEEAKAEEKSEGDIPAPKSEEEAEALKAVQAELGLADDQLKQVSETKVAAPQDKLAAAKVMYRAAILNKLAALKK